MFFRWGHGRHSGHVKQGLMVASSLFALLLAGCSSGSGPTSGSTGPTPPSGAAPSPSATGAPSQAGPDVGQVRERVSRLTVRQKAGQVIMAGVPIGAGPGTIASWAKTLQRDGIGNVFLSGRSQAGAEATARTGQRLRAATKQGGLAPWIAIDQEGGQVQTLRGPGLSGIPSARAQGRWDTERLQEQARMWGRQLADAGVNMNLAPVSDTVPAGTEAANAPIGAVQRNYGSDPTRVSRQAQAFAQGMSTAGITPVLKHFPGLGLVTADTDETAGVTDPSTDADGDQVAGFREQIAAGAPWVMMSSATYPRLDPEHPAMFSSAVITDLLRGELGFTGAVVSDDLCTAGSVQGIDLGQRAKRFLEAGGDLFLCAGGASQEKVRELSDAVVELAGEDRDFARALDRAAVAVVASKLD